MELTPITRKEHFLAKAAGNPNAFDLEPITREEWFISQIRGGSGGGGSGMTEDVKKAFLNAFAHVAWTDEHGQDYYDDLEAAFYPSADLVSIAALYTQSGTVYDTDSLDSLRADLVVTATYINGDVRTVSDYVLSGTLTEGTSTITVSYGGKTTTFTVTVSALAPTYTKTRSDCVIGALDNHASNANYIETSTTVRCSCKSLDMFISGNHTYRIVATSDDPTVKMGIQLYNKTAVDAIEANRNFSASNVQSFGWEDSLDATRKTDATYNGAAIKLLRLTFKKDDDSAFTSVPISKIEVYDITDVVTP